MKKYIIDEDHMNDLMAGDITSEFQFYGTNGVAGMKNVDFITKNNTFSGHASYRVKLSPINFFIEVQKLFKGTETSYNFIGDSFFITDKETFFTVYYDTFGKGKDLSGMYTVTISASTVERIDYFIETLGELMKTMTVNSVVWAILAPNGSIIYKEMQLSNKHTEAFDAFYPWLKGLSLADYYAKYLESDENVLLLTGIPGTGKTTFIKNLLIKNNLNAIITYDEKLMKDDQFFLDFITEDKDILIIEDADTLIYDREKEDNNLLSKILNVSDGLIKNIHKKIVFSTNITDIDRIDPALMRPGRCYDVLDFRRLTSDEAQKVLTVKGIERELKSTREYTLAELLTSGNRDQIDNRFKMGIR